MSDKVRIVSVETITHVCEFTYDEFRREMKQDDDDLTESSIMKMWLKLMKKKEHKIKDGMCNNVESKLCDRLYLVHQVLKLNK